MLMWLRMAPRLHLFFLLMIHCVSSADWGMNYSNSQICALTDSSVIISCNYTYPTEYQITKVFWTNDYVRGVEPPDLSEDPEYSQRLQYLGDKQQNCTVRLSHVTKKDEHKYYFRFTTNGGKVKWLGYPGVSLSVTDLQVESPERVKEGDSVRLICKSSCNLTDTPIFIWSRNAQPLAKSIVRNNELLLRSVSREDAGRYRCAVHGHTLTSPDLMLNVMYPPSSVLVFISRSAVIVSGDSVSLSCISDSNPPALNFSWFKGEIFAGSGRIFNISEISSDDNEQYKCKARNEHGEKYSDPVSLNIKSGRFVWWSLEFAGGIFLGVASAALIAVIYICFAKRKCKKSALKKSAISDRCEDTYDTLDLQAVTSDLYDTLTTVHPRPKLQS